MTIKAILKRSCCICATAPCVLYRKCLGDTVKKFKTVTYTIHSQKLHNQGFVIAMLSDLHNVELGEGNANLLQAIEAAHPDMICIAGDLVLGKKAKSVKPAYEFIKKSVKIAPVYYGLGNHEQRMKQYPEVYGKEYRVFEKKIQKLGVTMLENSSRSLEIKGEPIQITGLALPEEYYQKGKKIALSLKIMNRLVGKASKDQFQILLAHTPRYGDTYLEWGGDLTLSGHYHGGMMRLPLLGGVISPDFKLFPEYCRGDFIRQERHLIVSAGLGEHTLPIRIFNPRELVIITCVPETEKRKEE